MKHLKILGLAAVAAMALMAFTAAAASAATTLEVGGVTKNSSVAINASIESGTSAVLKDTFGISQNTCTSSNVNGSTSSPFTGSSVTGAISSLSFSNCTREVEVHKQGKLEVTYTSGTNGTVASEEAEVTVGSPVGTLICVTGATTNLGTLTGVKEGNATLHINAVITCTRVSTAKWTGTYTVTSPSGTEGLGVSP